MGGAHRGASMYQNRTGRFCTPLLTLVSSMLPGFRWTGFETTKTHNAWLYWQLAGQNSIIHFTLLRLMTIFCLAGCPYEVPLFLNTVCCFRQPGSASLAREMAFLVSFPFSLLLQNSGRSCSLNACFLQVEVGACSLGHSLCFVGRDASEFLWCWNFHQNLIMEMCISLLCHEATLIPFWNM